MDTSGYVNVQDVINWHKLKVLHASFDEIIACVQDNEKQRFGLRCNLADPTLNPEDALDSNTANMKGETPHQLALAHIEASSEPDAKDYSIRAVQGHSLKTIDATSLLSRITLDSIPETCVHGTFFQSWPGILKSGGLKAMTRNHVHFASGPPVADIVPNTGKDAATAVDAAGRDGLIEARDREVNLKAAMHKSEILSGMRVDAQVLIYVNVRRSIEEGKMQWWRSENGVILTEGIEMSEQLPSELEETALMLGETKVNGNGEHVHDSQSQPNKARTHNRRKSQIPAPKPQNLVPIAYWDVVVGIGIGLLWEREKGVVQEVSAALIQGGRKKFASSGNSKPRLKTGGKGSEKPKMKVERDDMDGFD